MMFNRTLLRDEGDEEEDTMLEKKKKEKERYADAERRKKLGNRKTSPAPDVYFNSAVTGMSPTGNMDDTTAVNRVPSIPPPPGQVTLQQSAHQQHQKISRQHVPQAQTPVHQHVQAPTQHIQAPAHQQHSQPIAKLLPPPPTIQHRTAVQYQPPVMPHAEAPYQPQHPPQPQGQSPYSAHPSHQMNYPAAQYPQTPVPQMPVYGNQAVPVQHSGVHRTQSVPVQQQVHEYPAQHKPLRHASVPESPPNIPESQDSWNTTADSTQKSWKGAQEAAGDNSSWAAFSPVSAPGEDMWGHELDEDHSSSEGEDEEDNRSSPVLLGEEGEVLLRAPSMTSFAESISSVEEESEDNAWRILPDQRDYYTKQFRQLQPVDGGVVKGPRARDFFMKSFLPTDTLSKIWHLSDRNKDNALNLDEFCIAMHLVVALRHGLELPETLPAVMLPEKKDSVDPFTVPLSDHSAPSSEHRAAPGVTSNHVYQSQLSSPEESLKTPLKRQDSSEEYVNKRRSYSDTSSLDEPLETPHRRVSVPVTQSPHAQVPDHSQIATPLSPGHTGTSEIARPRAVAKPSLLDAAPGQLLPPPSSKQAREGWTPIKAGQFVVKQAAAPIFPHQVSPPSSPISTPPTSPLSPVEASPPASPEPSGSEEVKHKEEVKKTVKRRASKRSGERPRSTGDVNRVVSKSDVSSGNVSADGKKEPPPPPPRKKGHSRASSLDLNKLFATRVMENRGTSSGSSNSSSHSSQNSEGPIQVKSADLRTPRKAEAEKPENDADSQDERAASPSQENFADFSKFDNFVKAQASASETKVKRGTNVTEGRQHKRSLSLDFGQVPVSGEVSHPANRGLPSQEALPRPVPKKKPQSPPALKLRKVERTSERDSEKERKLNTEPPKVVVRPLTKEDVLQSQIRDLKERNATLSRLNSKLQQELKEVMEARASLEVKLERLRPCSPSQ